MRWIIFESTPIELLAPCDSNQIAKYKLMFSFAASLTESSLQAHPNPVH
jgi:hypothetical protein